MKLQLDTTNKTIKIEESVNLSELVKHLEKLLPKDSPFGHWKEYKLETNTTIVGWNYYPFYVFDNTPTIQPYVFRDTSPTVVCDKNAPLTTFTVPFDNSVPMTFTGGIYNVELN